LNPDGSLDTGFGTNGKVVTPIGSGFDQAHSMALQPDGKLLVGGAVVNGPDANFAIVRYNPNGALDPAFGSNGIVQTNFSPDNTARINSLLLQPNGKILAGGTIHSSASRFGIARYNITGSIDSAFGSNGFVTTPIAVFSEIFSQALQPDGKIVAAGRSSTNLNGNNDFTLARYQGAPTFANLAGRVTTSSGEGIGNVTIKLEGGALTTPRSTITNPFGYYQFSDVPTANNYLLTLSRKGYVFASSPFLFNFQDGITNLDFIGSH
jgi:uncharacterized delta-60 repeat protein